MPLSTSDKLGIGQLGLSAITGLLGGMDTTGQKQQQQLWQRQDQQTENARQDELFQALLAALNNQSNVEGDLNNENLQRALAFSNANPLGAEQNYRQNVVFKRAGLGALGDRQLAHGTPNIAAGFLNRPGVSDVLSDQSINDAINQRRIATAGLNPSAAQEIGTPNNYAQRLFGDLQASNDFRRQNAQNAFNLIQGRRNALADQFAQSQVPQQPEGPSKKKSILGTLLGVGGLAANFIPGVGPIAGTLISAATGAAGGALAGGKKGALIGGAGNTAASIGLNKTGLGESAPRSLNNGMTANSLPQSVPFPFDARNALGGGGLQLPSTPNVMSGLAGVVGQNRPNIQQALSRPPQAQTQSIVPQSGPSFGFGNGLNFRSPQIYPTFSGSSDGSLVNRSLPISSNNSLPSVPSSRFSDAKVGGYGNPIDQSASSAYGNTAGPGVMYPAITGAGIGAAGLLGAYGLPTATTMAASPQGQRLLGSPAAQGALNGVQGVGQRLLGSGQQFLQNPRIAGLLPATSQTGDAQNTVAKLIELFKAYNSGSPADIQASQDIVKLMQPYLGKF